MTDRIEKSKGHLAFMGSYEYYQFKDDIYRALIDNPVMPDGYRCGRFETRSFLWKDRFNQLNNLFGASNVS